MFTHLESAAWINGYDEPDMPCIVLKGNIESATAVEVVFVLKDLAT
jgi:hypothetical protein